MTLASKVARLVGISPASCRRIAAGAHRRYKRFAIPKRTPGEYRLVAQPAREVKLIQRGVVEVLSPLLKIHENATAYRPGSSIKENAQRHAGAKFITKLDFSSFFPSIDASAISRLLRNSIEGIAESDVSFVLSSCLWWGDGRHALCIGAPSSPFLSNAVMYEFDANVSNFCSENGCVYTRYSDDICISSREPDALALIEDLVRKLCVASRHPRLVLNDKKRVAVGRSTSMTVTGLTLTNQGGVSVGRARKRGVRAGVNRFVYDGMSLDQQDVLKGEIAFVLSIEPNFRYVLLETYGPRIEVLLPR